MVQKKRNFIFVIAIITLSIILIREILFPSYVSVAVVCLPGSLEVLEDLGGQVTGTTTFIQNETFPEGKIEVQLAEGFENNEETIKHEQCHVRQFQRGFPSASCVTPVQKYLTEVECYSVEKLPTPIYEIFYGEI